MDDANLFQQRFIHQQGISMFSADARNSKFAQKSDADDADQADFSGFYSDQSV
jgi:hypothetical protein